MMLAMIRRGAEHDGSASERRRHGRYALVALVAGAAGLALLGAALDRIGVGRLLDALSGVQPGWLAGACALMLAAVVLRGLSWLAVLRAALPEARIPIAPVLRATMIGVMASAALPARAGEPARAVVLARRLGRVRSSVSVLGGTILSQTLLNVAALLVLGAIVVVSTRLLGRPAVVLLGLAVPLGATVGVLASPATLDAAARRGPGWSRRIVGLLARELRHARRGLRVFVRARHAIAATTAQFAAWAIQVAACYAVLTALGLAHGTGLVAAAAVLVAVNVTAVVPVTPSNVGVFQATCVAVLSAFGVASARGLAYGIVLQGVEVIAAIAAGIPALIREGLTWRDLRSATT
jgi:phosphatidylinositol alpha-mannosyltransferase